MPVGNSNTFVLPSQGASIAISRSQFNSSLKALLQNFYSTGSPDADNLIDSGASLSSSEYDGMLYRNEEEEVLINQTIIATEKSESINGEHQIRVNKKQEDLNTAKWFANDYFVNNVMAEIEHFIGKESPVMKYVPGFVSQNNSVFYLQGNHENILEIDDNLETISTKIIRHGKK